MEASRDAPWSYELPPGGSGAWGIEEYTVETADGERVGTVAAVLDRDGDVFVAIERGVPPAAHDLRAVEWDHVLALDPGELAVRLDLTADELERALRLAPDKKVEGAPAEARRIDRPPPLLREMISPDRTVARERPLVPIAIGLVVVHFFLVLIAVILGDQVGAVSSVVMFAVAIAVGVAGLVLLVRAYRDRSTRRRTPRTPAGGRPEPPSR